MNVGPGRSLRILLTGNSCFMIANFRAGLLRDLIQRGHEVTALAPFDGHEDRLLTFGCLVHDLPMDRNGTAPWGEAVLLWRIFRFLRRARPDVVFSYTIKNNIYAGLACRLLGIHFVPNVTGLGPAFNQAGLLNRVVRALYRLAFARAASVFFQNTDDRATFLRARLTDDGRARLLPGSGVDLARFAQRPMPQGDGTTFLLVSRLLWDKGIGLYVEAARALRRKYPGTRFQVLGPPDPASRSGIPMAEIEAWAREGAIEYLGHVDDVRPALAAAHCIVLPSWYREGIPRVLLEAAATGRPVITTDMPGCRDAVEDGRTGFLCAARDGPALEAVMTRFHDLPDSARAAMGQAARRRAELIFDETRVIAAYLDQLPRPF
jgi:glycosyltransferase involved in cell wall biosynthesis